MFFNSPKSVKCFAENKSTTLFRIFPFFFSFLLFVTLLLQSVSAQDNIPELPFDDNITEREEKNYLKLDFELYSRIITDHRVRSKFYVGLTSPLDKGSIALLGQYDFVDVYLGLKLEECYNSTIHTLKFDSAYLKVNDLLNNFLDIRFFDIAYGAGNGYSIRPELSANGVEFTLKPIPELKLAFGYGIGQEEFELYAVSNGIVQTTINEERTTITPIYHTLTFNLRYDNDYVPFSFYYGITLINSKGSYFAKSFLPFYTRDSLLHTSLGIELDLLAYFKKDVLRFDMAFTLPVGTLSRKIYIGENGTYDNQLELNFLFQFYGDTELIWGIGLSYQLLFALDSHTKQKVLGNRYDHYFKEAFKIALTPRYTYGPVNIDVGVVYGIIGGKTARSAVDRNRNIIFNKSKVYNNIALETGVNWTPFPFSNIGRDFRIRGYYKFDFGDIQLDGDHIHELGLQLKMSFNTLAFD